MRKLALILIMPLSFVALLPLSWRLADPLFWRPFDKNLVGDPVLLVCPDRVEVLRLHDISGGQSHSGIAGCTFNVAPERQEWVENALRVLPTPIPSRASWRIRIKQVNEADQQIDLGLLGDGISGLLYEVKRDEIIPLKSRLTGAGGALYALAIDFGLWTAAWRIFLFGRRLIIRARASATLNEPETV